MATMTTESGREKTLPAGLDPERVAGLDEDGRIVVHDFGIDAEFYFGLTLCCNASDKGGEDGIYCRACYDDADIGNYLYRQPDGTYPGLDPIKTVRPA